MKKLSYLIALSAIMMSCTHNEVINKKATSDENQIGFSPIIGKQTKAQELTLAMLEADANGFKSYGYITPAAENFANATSLPTTYFDINIKKEASVWTANPNVYWPTANENLSVFSFYPSNGATYVHPTYASGVQFPALKFTTQSAVKDQKDLIVSNEMDKTKGSSANNIAISFKHVLSQVRFNARAADDTYKVVVKEIKVLQANSEGTFTFDGSAAVGSWSNQQTPANYTLYSNAAGITCGNAITPIITDATDYSLMLVPQPKSGNFKFSVTYDVLSAFDVLLKSNIMNMVDMEAMSMGKKYAYNLTLPVSPTIVPITFTLDITNWEAASDIDVSNEIFEFSSDKGLSDQVIKTVTDFNTNRKGITAIHTLELKGTLAASTTIDLTSILSANLKATDYIILDCNNITFGGSSITINAGSNWKSSTATLSAPGTIKLTK